MDETTEPLAVQIIPVQEAIPVVEVAPVEAAPVDPDPYKLSKIAVGTFAPLGGMVADSVRSRILDRAGIPRLVTDTDGTKQIHPLRAALLHTHAGTQDKAAVRLPEVFPPADYVGPLSSAKDWLDLIDSVLIDSATIA